MIHSENNVEKKANKVQNLRHTVINLTLRYTYINFLFILVCINAVFFIATLCKNKQISEYK